MICTRMRGFGLVLAGSLVPALALAQGGTGGTAGGGTAAGGGVAGSAPGGAPGMTTTFSLRTRAESWNWFDTRAVGDGRYTYLGAIARLGVSGRRPGLGWTLEAAAPVLLGLPDDAISGAPRGQLGLGASYFAANDRERDVAQLFLKQAFLRLGAAPGQGGHALRLGRFEFAEGTELAPADPTLAAVKSSRVAQRLIGPFPWTHVGRAFDGAHYSFDRKARPAGPGPWNVTLAAFAPTEGAFQANGWRPLPVAVGYASYNRGLRWGAGGQSDLRLFGILYEDRRDTLRFSTTTPGAILPASQRASGGRVRVQTFGGHLVHVLPTAAGPLDLLAWGAVQRGDWGRLDHRANAAALEAGWQPAGVPWRPWVRAIWFHGSGDASATDGRHGTFFELLPTPRPFARFPLHNLMNLEQSAASLTLRPHPRVTLRSDVNALRLAEAADLWYVGGGAFERESFGYAGRPSNGRRRFASLTDLSADLRLTRRLAVNGYLARAGDRDVVRAIYPGTGPAYFGYVELDVRY